MNLLRRIVPALVPLALCLAPATVAVAQTSAFGYSCRLGTNECLTKNTQFTTNTTLPNTNAWIYLRVTAPAGGINVSGFSLLLRSTSAPNVRVATRLLAATASNAPGTVLETGRPIYVDSTQRWCTTWFHEHQFAAGTVFYIGYENPASGVSLGGTSNSSGLAVNWFYRPNGGSLSSLQVAKWKYKIVCDGGSPNVRSYTSPSIGTTFTWGVDNTGANTPAIPYYGLSNTSGSIGGNVYPLPLDLTFLGAPQCDVLISPEVFCSSYYFQTTWRTDLQIPNDPLLRGFRFYGQWLIASGANSLGYSFSDAMEVTVQ